MTIEEICIAIEAETRTKTWSEATLALRLLVIKGCIESLEAELEQAAKKVVKQRKPRKAKTVPLTQHAEGSE